MSIWIYSHVWIFAKDPTDLDSITNDQLNELAVGSLEDLTQSVERINSKFNRKKLMTVSELIDLRKSLAGRIEKRQPLILEIEAGGECGSLLRTLELSRLYTDLYFVEICGCDVDIYEDISLIKKGETIISKKIISHNFDREMSLYDSINCLTYLNMEKSFPILLDRLISEDIYWESYIPTTDLILQIDPEV